VDRGRHFINNLVSSFARRFGTPLVTTIGKRANGSIEVLNREVVNLMAKLCIDLDQPTTYWIHLVDLVQQRLNNRTSATIGGYAPVQLFTGQAPSGPFDHLSTTHERIWHNLKSYDTAMASIHLALDTMMREATSAGEKKRQAARAARNSRTSSHHRFAPGDLCWLRHNSIDKLGKKWIGPVRLDTRISPKIFEVSINGRVRQVNTDDLRPTSGGSVVRN